MANDFHPESLNIHFLRGEPSVVDLSSEKKIIETYQPENYCMIFVYANYIDSIFKFLCNITAVRLGVFGTFPGLILINLNLNCFTKMYIKS